MAIQRRQRALKCEHRDIHVLKRFTRELIRVRYRLNRFEVCCCFRLHGIGGSICGCRYSDSSSIPVCESVLATHSPSE